MTWRGKERSHENVGNKFIYATHLLFFGANIVLLYPLDLFDSWLLCRLHAASEPKYHVCRSFIANWIKTTTTTTTTTKNTDKISYDNYDNQIKG